MKKEKTITRISAFTLMELLVVIFILSVMMVSVLSIKTFLRPKGVQLAVEQLRADLRLARLMAINNKKSCAIRFNQPQKNQYTNSINGKSSSLEKFRGGVCFLKNGPDGGKMNSTIIFQRRGMARSLGDVYLSDTARSRIYKVRVTVPGNISVYSWNGNDWV